MKSPPRDPEIVWRKVIALRCEWITMKFGNYRWATLEQLVTEQRFHAEPERYGPPIPGEPQ
jgi:hypothetical protein